MKRTQVQFDETTYEALRRKAFQERRSLSAVVRAIVADALGGGDQARGTTLKSFRFVGAGRSRQGRLRPVSERHDEALGEAFGEKGRR